MLQQIWVALGSGRLRVRRESHLVFTTTALHLWWTGKEKPKDISSGCALMESATAVIVTTTVPATE